MPTIKSSPSELAIHGGGPPAFASRLPVSTANVGDGQRFGALAEQMFLANEPAGGLAEQFEAALADWLGVRNVVGFSSLPASIRCIERSLRSRETSLVSALGAGIFQFELPWQAVECEPGTFGISPSALADRLRAETPAVLAVNALGRACCVEDLEDLCDEWSVPLFLFGHQALGACYASEKLGGFGRAEIFELGRDQLVHAMDSAVIATDDDLLAYRLRSLRSSKSDGVDQAISDAASAMAIANLESADAFVAQNRIRYEQYRLLLADVPGIKLVKHDRESTFQSIAIEVDPGLSGLTRNALYDVLLAENVGTAKPFEHSSAPSTPIASRLAASLLQLPNGPTLNEEIIEAVCKLVELAIIRSLESPDPIRLAA